MDDSEDIRKIDEIIKKHKIEPQDSEELDYAEFIDYTDQNDDDDIIEIDEYEISDFHRADITIFNSYDTTTNLLPEEKRIIDSCTDPDLKQLLLLNRNKNIQLMQLHRKIKNLLVECQENISLKEMMIQSKHSKRVFHKIWRLGIPYFKSEDGYPCPRNEDTIRKHNNGELNFYEMAPSYKWFDKDASRLLQGVVFYYKAAKEDELQKKIRQLKRELAEKDSDLEREELSQELTNNMENLEDIKSSQCQLFPPLGDIRQVDWTKVSENFLANKYPVPCCQFFWNNYLHPDINKGGWTSTEELELRRLATKYNHQNWDLIAAELGTNRTGYIVCMYYFSKVDPPRRGRFTPAEDKLLCELVEQYKQGEYIPWAKIAHYFQARTRSQLFYRYKYFLCCQDGIIKGKFTEAEDILIMVLVDKFGKKFSKCAKYFPNRSVVQIKARYSSNLRGALKKGSFTIEEDKQILEYIREHGSGSLEPLVPLLNRCGGQIRQRYATLKSFLKLHPESDLSLAPRRRFGGLSSDTSYNYLRCMADQFKNCEKIPTLQDIETLLAETPKPQDDALEEVDQESSMESNNKTVRTYRRKSIVKKDAPSKKEKDEPPDGEHADKESNHEEDAFGGMSLSIDDVLTNFFSNSIRQEFVQQIEKMQILKAASAVSSMLSMLQVKLHIPVNFKEDSRLDSLDVDILTAFTEKRPISQAEEYVINRGGLEIDRLVPPNLNTIVGMRSLLIQNQIYKSKITRKAYIFGAFKTERKEKQVQWCINTHLSIQPPGVRQELVTERNLFFRRFVSLFKFPAIMTLQSPSTMLETRSPDKRVLRTYKKKSISQVQFETVNVKPPPQDENFETNANIRQHDFLENCSQSDSISSSENVSGSVENRALKVASDSDQKPTIAEKLKRKIYETIDELTNNPSKKRFLHPSTTIGLEKYNSIENRVKKRTPDLAKKTVSPVNSINIVKKFPCSSFNATAQKRPRKAATEPVKAVEEFNATAQKGRRKAAAAPVKTVEEQIIKEPQPKKPLRITYASKRKAKVKPTNPITVDLTIAANHTTDNNIRLETDIQIREIKKEVPGKSQPRGNFNPGKGEFVLENDSPCDSIHSDYISQDLQDLNIINDFLKKEVSTVEESFDF